MSPTIPDLNQPCPNCDHPLKFHDPEDGSCDVFSGNYKIGACPCGRRSQPVARHIPDDQVAWYAGTSRTAKWTAEMSTSEDIVALAREVQERRQEGAEFMEKWRLIRAEQARTPSFTDDEMETIRRALECWWEHCTCDDYHDVKNDPVDKMTTRLLAWVLGDPSPAPCACEPNALPAFGRCPSCGGEK